MKTTFHQLIFLSVCGLWFSEPVAAQCNDYYELSKGTSWTFENYSAKGKLQSKNQQTVTSYENTATGYKATIHSETFSEKGKKQMEADMEVSCNNGTYLMDMRRFVPQEQLEMFKSYEVKLEGENLELPSRLTEGQSLKSGWITLTAVGSPLPLNLKVDITDRKVEGKETITTPAGTFTCWKISSKSSLQIKMGINMNLNFSIVEWMAEKVGLVKSEMYDKKGALSSYSLLVSRQ
jgi:hypothetical protein